MRDSSMTPRRSAAFCRYSTRVGIDAHDAAAGGVDGGQIGTHHQDAGLLRSALDRAVAFHAHDAVHQAQNSWRRRRGSVRESNCRCRCSAVRSWASRRSSRGPGRRSFSSRASRPPNGESSFWRATRSDRRLGRCWENRILAIGEALDGAYVVAIEIDEHVVELAGSRSGSASARRWRKCRGGGPGLRRSSLRRRPGSETLLAPWRPRPRRC